MRPLWIQRQLLPPFSDSITLMGWMRVVQAGLYGKEEC